MEATRVLHEPARRIDSFDTTAFDFAIVSGLMDSIDQVRIRDGRIEAGSPKIVSPESFNTMQFEGFGEQAEQFANWVRESLGNLAILKYGFEFRRTDVREHLVHDSMEVVRERLVDQAKQSGNPSMAVIEGVDDTWEISLLKFSLDMVRKSSEINRFDFKRRGLI